MVDADHDGRREVRRQGGVEQGEALLRRERHHAGPGHPGDVAVVQPRGQAAALCPHAPGHGLGGQPCRPPVLGEAVEEGVGSGVVGLAGGAEAARRRREQHERGQILVPRQLVQVEGGVGLGAQDPAQAFGREVGQDSVVEDARGVHDRGQRPVQRVQYVGQRVPVRDVAGDGADVGAGDLRGGAAAAEHDQVADAVLGHEMSGDEPGQHSAAAGEQDRALGVEPAGRGEDELADVLGLAEEAHRLAGTAQVPAAGRQRRQHALLEEGEHLGQHRVDPVEAGVHQLEGAVAHPLVGSRHPLGVAEVGPAHLDEASAARHQAQRGVDELAGEGVENDVHAPAAGGGQEGALEVGGAGGGQVAGVESGRVPLAGAGRAVDLGPEVAGELDGGHADTARGGVHEDALAGAQICQVDQSVVGGEEDHGGGGGLFEGPLLGHPGQHPPVGDRDRPVAAGEHPEDPVPDREIGDARPGRGDDSGALDAHRARFAGEQAEGVERVTEVHAGGADLDAHLVVGRRGEQLGRGQQRQVLQRAAFRGAQQPRGRAVGGWQQGVPGAGTGQPRPVGDAVAEHELRFAGRRGGGHQVVGRLVGVDQNEAVGVLRLSGTDQAPHRGVRGIHVGVRLCGHGRSGADDEGAVLGEGRLQPGEHLRGHLVDRAVADGEHLGLRVPAVGVERQHLPLNVVRKLARGAEQGGVERADHQ